MDCGVKVGMGGVHSREMGFGVGEATAEHAWA